MSITEKLDGVLLLSIALILVVKSMSNLLF